MLLKIRFMYHFIRVAFLVGVYSQDSDEKEFYLAMLDVYETSLNGLMDTEPDYKQRIWVALLYLMLAVMVPYYFARALLHRFRLIEYLPYSSLE